MKKRTIIKFLAGRFNLICVWGEALDLGYTVS